MIRNVSLIIIVVLSLFTSAFATTGLTSTQAGVKKKILYDIDMVEIFTNASMLSSSEKRDSIDKLNQLRSRADTLVYPLDATGFRAILPFHEIQEDVYRVYAKVLDLYTPTPLFVWHTAKNEKMDLFVTPVDNLSALEIKMMQNEYRFETLNITNSSTSSKTVDIELSNLPLGASMEVFRGEFVDSKKTRFGPGGYSDYEGTNALIQLSTPYSMTIPSGMTKQVTFLINSKNISAGSYPIKISLKSGSFEKLVDLNLIVSDVVFPTKLDYSLLMYDMIVNKTRGITEENQQAAALDYIKHYGNTVAVVRPIVPIPTSSYFDSSGNLKSGFDFSRWDQVITLFPDAKYYLAHIDISGKFAGFTAGTPLWERALGTWAKAFGDHMISLNKDPSQLVLELGDEPRSDSALERSTMFIKAVKKIAPTVTTYCTLHAKSGIEKFWGQELLKNVDIACIARHHFNGRSSARNNLNETQKAFYRGRINRGKQLWFYGTRYSAYYSPEFRMIDMMKDFYNGSSGGGYWAYADIGSSSSSWNMYATYRNYSPLFIDKNSITTGRQWEAMREAIQNIQYLIMLRDIVANLEAQGTTSADIDSAKRLLLLSNTPTSAQEIEDVRVEALELIEKLHSNSSSILYSLNIVNGTGNGMNKAGDRVTIVANTPNEGYVFDGWTSSGGGVFLDASSATTQFIMTAYSTDVTANFKEEILPDPDPDPDPDPAVETRVLKIGSKLKYGDVAIGSSLIKELTLTNLGNSDLEISEIYFHESIADAYSSTWSGVIRAGESQQVPIEFKPMAEKRYDGSVYVSSNKTNGGDSDKGLFGKGI